jgi:splicing factor 3B subunit 2
LAEKVPPPWLIAMQRYGPPPSYPSLKIAGLNAPIPAACSFGYHAGGWGKPPVDECGRPLYGDVFGSAGAALRPPSGEEAAAAAADGALWGEMEDEVWEEVAPAEDEEEEGEEGEAEGVGGDEAEAEAAAADVGAEMGTPAEGYVACIFVLSVSVHDGM